MKALVCGGRDFKDFAFVCKVLDGINPTSVIHGGAKGADTMASLWARERGVPQKEYIADWKAHGRKAGPLRNERMLREGMPDVIVAFPGGRGTAHMVRISTEAGVPVIDVSDQWMHEAKMAAATSFMEAMGSND